MLLHESHQGINDLPQGLKSYPIQFSRNLQIVHLFDTLHIGKDITKMLW